MDFGSIEGGSSLYSRSNRNYRGWRINLFTKQHKSIPKSVWGDLEKKTMFENLNDLEILINKVINNEDLSNNILVSNL